MTKAKRQARSLPEIRGHTPTATYVHVAYFERDRWCAYLEDPPRQRQLARQGQIEDIDPASLTVAYYVPIVNAIRARQPRIGVFQQADGLYLQAYFAEVDLYVAVRNDIATLIPADDTAAISSAEREPAASLYELVLNLDESQGDYVSPDGSETNSFFIGGDGKLRPARWCTDRPG